MKITTFLITALANIVIGVVMFFMLILSMNGFHEDEATPGLLLFIVWGLLSAIITGILSYLLANYLETKILKSLAAHQVDFVIVGGVSTMVGFFAAIFLASALR